MPCCGQERGAFKEPKEGPGSYSKGQMWLKVARARPHKAQAAIVINQVFSTGA